MRSTIELILLALLLPVIVVGLGLGCVAVHLVLQRKSQERRAELYAEKEKGVDDSASGGWTPRRAWEQDPERAVFRPRREVRGVQGGWSLLGRGEEWV